MNDNLGLTGGLVVAMALVIAFFVFSHKIGALRAFGRYPMSWRKIMALSGAAALPGIAAFASIFISTWPLAAENHEAMAIGMAAVGWGCMLCMRKLQHAVLKKGDAEEAPADAAMEKSQK